MNCADNKKGTTLIEILVATLVFVVALGALLSSITALLYLVDLSKEQTIAVGDSRNMMEKIRATAFADMQTQFPNAVIDGPSARSYSTVLGGYALSSEHITVTYANINSDPLEIKVSVSWQDKRRRGRNVSSSTFKTR
jgi:Tfp pilus assembly protein PilV